ncbi:NUDIX hydrolase [Chloroflexota bacterium]
MVDLPPGDSRRYPKSPRVSANVTVLKDNEVLLIKRGYQPYKDTWAPPGGRVELGETVLEGGIREVREESAVECEIEGILKIDDHIRFDAEGKVEVHMVLIRLLAKNVRGTPKAGSDAADVGWFTIENWKDSTCGPTYVTYYSRQCREY